MTTHESSIRADRYITSGTVRSGDDGRLFLLPDESTACEHCGARLVCRPDDRGTRFTLPEQLSTAPGERLAIYENGHLLLLLSLLQYGLPLLGFLAGLLIPFLLFPNLNEALLFLCGLLTMTAAATMSRRLIGKISLKGQQLFSYQRL